MAIERAGRVDWESDGDLRALCERVRAEDSNPTWHEHLKSTLAWWSPLTLEERSAPEAQERLWEDNGVASAGQGNIALGPALEDSEFRRWVAKESQRPLPMEREARVAAIDSLYQQMQDQFRTREFEKVPHLKILRVLAVCFPLNLTSIADRGTCKKFARLIAGTARGSLPEVHQRIRDRVDGACGPFDPDDLDELVFRIQLPWKLYAQHLQGLEEGTTCPSEEPGEERLVPASATKRRQLSTVAGHLDALLEPLEFISSGVTREEALDHLRVVFPSYQDSSRVGFLSVLRAQLDLIRQDGDRLRATERGQALLETEDPDVLRDWILTRVLGADHALVALRQCGVLSQPDLEDAIRLANPNWTSSWGTNAIVRWFVSLGVITQSADYTCSLTERGREWAQLINWTPDNRKAVVQEPGIEVSSDSSRAPAREVERPGLPAIIARVKEAGVFSPALVHELDAGLWADRRRHFAVLTGLSGSGKTLLAKAYGEVIAPRSPLGDPRVAIVQVQPGWYDPTALLGYMNPLRAEAYERTAFLNLVLRAAADPTVPHVAILDEMNLSHPEQYLAPVLSAMETGDDLRLHERVEPFDGVPPSVPYPVNLVIIGTVNMDETTQGLSDKVLDRAFVHEFWDIDLGAWPRWGKTGIAADEERVARGLLEDLFGALRPARLHFGWRTVEAVFGFLRQREREGGALSPLQALDRVVFAKLLPKLRGDDSPRFKEALEGCREILRRHELPLSAEKVDDLLEDLRTLGTARFWR